MTFSKSVMNLIFGTAVAVLALTASFFLFSGADHPATREQPPAAETQVPENHPPVDATGRIAALEQLMAREPQNPDYPTQIGNLYYDLANYGKAAEYYQRSLNLRPKVAGVETDLATCLHYLGQDDKSLEILDNVLEYNPGFSQDRFEEEMAENELRRRMMMESARDLEVDLGNMGIDDQPEVSLYYLVRDRTY